MGMNKDIKWLIEQFVDDVLNEAFRGFNFKKFKNLNVEDKLNYAKKYLPLLGKGTSRIAFGLGGGKVLKIVNAENKTGLQRGFEQNKAEVELYTNPETKPVIAPIYNAADDYSWLVTEPVKEFKSEADFRAGTGLNWRQLTTVLKNSPLVLNKNTTYPEDAIEEIFEKRIGPVIADQLGMDTVEQGKKRYIKIYNHPITQAMLHLIEMGLHPPDVALYKHWGKTVSGKTVLLDYGATRDLFRRMYLA